MTTTVVSGRTRDLVITIDIWTYRLAKHWLLFANASVGAFAMLPILAPILMAWGYNEPANLIYTLYSFTCHQMPSRSYFIFGHQVAWCQRDFAIYTSIFLAGLVYARVRHWLKPLSLSAYLVAITPMAIDGFTQLIGLRLSNWELRTMTGGLFGVASVWMAYPYVEESFQEIRQQVNAKLHLE